MCSLVVGAGRLGRASRDRVCGGDPACPGCLSAHRPRASAAATRDLDLGLSAATLLWDADARAHLAQGLDLRIEALACRKLIAPGCYAYGGNPPSALETIRTLGTELGPLVVIDVGYNDGPDEYAEGLNMVMQALVDAHVERLIWMTLNEHEDVWIQNNANIRDAPKRWPQLVVADWAPVAAENPSWFADLVHLNADGAVGFAHFLRPIILTALTNCARACELPAATH